MKTAANKLYTEIPEKAFTTQVIALARWFKWRVAHFRPAMTKRGKWVTAVSGDGAGFPDLVLVRANRLIFAELKARHGRTTSEQDKWLTELRRSNAEVYVWRPEQIDEIEEVLKQ